MVALNYQNTNCNSLHMNSAMFHNNGRVGCGYVLKPECMRRSPVGIDPHGKADIPGVARETLSLEILSGQQLSAKHPLGHLRMEVRGNYGRMDGGGLPCTDAQTKPAVQGSSRQ